MTDEKLDNIIGQLTEFNLRITALEARSSQSQATSASENSESTTQNSTGPPETQQQQANNENSSAIIDTAYSHPTADISRQFDSLKERLSRAQLPTQLKINETSSGIKQEFRPSLKIISKCARHAETGLRLLSVISNPDNELPDHSFKLSADDVQDLYAIFASQTTFLQSEYANIVVKSTFNAETSRLFRSFENNGAAFTDSSQRNVPIAAELANVTQRADYSTNSRAGFCSKF